MPTSAALLPNPAESTVAAPPRHSSLPLRLSIAAAVLTLETCAVAALGHPWLPTGQIATGPIVFLAALLFFGRNRLRASPIAATPVDLRYLAAHLLAVAEMLAITIGMLQAGVSSPIAITAWALSLAAMPATLLCAIIPSRTVAAASRRLGSAWLYAVVCAALAVFARQLIILTWNAPDSALGATMANAAFAGARLLLAPFYPNLIADPSTRILGTATFQIHVAGVCSGIEGLALTLIFLLGWMFCERRHLRLARAALLIPLALGLIWALNLVRLATLIAIGAHGYPELALTGFHTEAGWIAFTAVSLGVLVLANRTPWFHRDTQPIAPQAAEAAPNIAAIYLLPLVAILATSLLTRAASTGFEALYPLRLLAALAVFIAFRKHYLAMHWTTSWLAALIGLALGVAWIYFAHTADPTLAQSLAQLTSTQRTLWLTARTLAAVITVPLAEELAFRGFLARFFTSPSDPEAIDYRQLSLRGILFSALAFAALHGRLWPLALLSGLAFAWLARRRNSLGEALTANAVAALTIAVWALTRADYSLWQ